MYSYYRMRSKIRSVMYNLKCKWQRFRRGYAYSDVWDISQWFIDTMKPMLTYLRDNCCGCPPEFYDAENDSADAWRNVLTEMIDCLEFMYEDNVRSYLGFDDWRDMTPDDYGRVHQIMDNNKNRFFELFGEYFYDLWD